jgi:hypothetical protein
MTTAATRRIARHHVGDIHRIPKAGIDVGNHRRLLHLADRAHHLQMRPHWQDVGIGHRIGRRKLKAAAPDRVEARIRRELGRKRIVCRHRKRGLADIELGAQRGSLRIALRHRRSNPGEEK